MVSHLPLRLAIALLAMGAVLPPVAGHAQAPAAAAPRTDPIATSMAHISVLTAGRGSPVILIPGLSSPRETWAETWPALAKNHRVYLVQVNGFAGDDPRGNLSPGVLDGVVADLHAYIAREKIAGAAVVGHRSAASSR